MGTLNYIQKYGSIHTQPYKSQQVILLEKKEQASGLQLGCSINPFQEFDENNIKLDISFSLHPGFYFFFLLHPSRLF
jgi:hypothetical protein